MKQKIFFMKKKLTKIATKALSSLVVASMMLSGFSMTEVKAATAICETYSGSNVESQGYSRWTKPIASYLTALDDGTLMRVQYGSKISGLLVEYYDQDYNVISSKLVDEELSIFGGFYATDSNYFVVTGQSNTEESDTKEVYRITKYDKNWEKIKSVGLNNCNTTVPFDAGSCRMDVCGKYLLIRTSHEMYTSSDGYNHQANVTIEVDMDTMTITDSYTEVMNSRMGYVSHSFNQFIKIENNKIVAVDHGDAHPRSIALLKYQTDASTGKFVPDYFSSPCEVIDVLTFPGASGQNTTGASVGGFEISSSNYLVAGNSVVQDESNLTRTTRNVFVAAVDKSSSVVNMNWLTSYDEGDGTTSTPQMVKVSANQYIVLWSRDKKVYYTSVNGNGVKSDEVYSMDGNLSDCVPVVTNGKLVWYTWNQNVIAFYDINVNDLSSNNKTEIVNGHHYENQGVVDGVADLKCSVCQKEEQVKVATALNIWWSEEGSYTMTTAYNGKRNIGEKFNCIVYTNPSDANDEMEIISSDPSVASVEMTNSYTGLITTKDAGTTQITVRAKYNPGCYRTYNLTVNGPLKIKSFVVDKTSGVTYGDTVNLTANAVGGNEMLQYKFYEKLSSGETKVIRDYDSRDTYQWQPDSAGIRTLYVDVKDGDGTVLTESFSDFVVNPQEKAPNMPGTTINVSNSVTTVEKVELPDGWSWQEEDQDKDLIVGADVTAKAIYEDRVNYRISSVEVSIYRSECEHIESELIIDVEATCIETGIAHTQCSICDELLRTNIETPIIAHNYGDWKYENDDNHITTCQMCGDIIRENHHWNDGVVTKQSTTTEEGVQTFKCIECGTEKTEKIPKLTHTICPPAPHVEKNVVFEKNGMKYKVTKAGRTGQAEVELVSVDKNKKSATVPENFIVGGVKCKVTSISAKAFSGNKKITKVVIGKNVKAIGKKAFYKCKKLKKITIKSSVLKKVGKQAIQGIHKKAVVKVPKKKLKAYKKLFGKKSGFKKTMKIKK